MADLIDEIQEDLKEEKYSKIVRKFSKVFLTIAFVSVISTCIYVWNTNNNKNKQEKLSIIFNKAIILSEQNDLEAAIKLFDEVSSNSNEQYAALALLNKAAIYTKQNKFDEAQKALEDVYNSRKFDSAFKDLAQIVSLGNKLGVNNIEESDADKLSEASKSNQPWQVSALQLKALYDLKQNKLEEAKQTLQTIIESQQASKYSRDTAASILAVISRSK